MKLNHNKYCTILLKLSLLQGQPVWWTVTLQRPGFVSKIWIINRLGCCFAQMPKHKVNLSNSVKTEKANCKVYSRKDTQKTLMICEPFISASNVTIYEDDVDDLSLCEVMITAVGEKCKRILFYTEYTQIDYLIYNPLNLKSVNPKKHRDNKIPPRCKFAETLTIWTCWYSCCASETRF